MTPINMIISFIFGLFIPCLSSASSVDATSVSIKGKLSIDPNNISGMVITDGFMALATDEGTTLQILPRKKNQFIALPDNRIVLSSGTEELDIEGLAWQAPYLYAIGSHSKKRKKIKADFSNKKNLKRLSQIHDEPARNQLFRVRLDHQLKVRQIESLSLMPIIKSFPLLKPFSAIPSKENGIDIEGIAVHGKQLYIGFRGPVLRGNFVPILKLTFSEQGFDVRAPKLKLVNLGGLGIRDMIAFEETLYLLSGPINDLPDVYHIHAWNGKTQWDALPSLKTLSEPLGKPEALVVTRHSKHTNLRFWVGQDGLKKGGIQSLD